MSILVTGASGFIGRHLAARLQAEHPYVRLHCLIKPEEDAFYQAGAAFLRSRSIQMTPADLLNGFGLENLRNPELVFHLAANTHTWDRNHASNDRGTENLLRALGPLGPNNHIVFTSTTAVMDNRHHLLDPLQPEPSPDRPPLSKYGQSKWRAEQFLRKESERQGFRLSIVRLCTVYGPEPRPNTLFAVLKREVTKRTLASRLNWPGLTSFIHVDDVVQCLLHIADAPPEPATSRMYLLATESKTLAEVARLLYGALGLAYRMVSLPREAWQLLRHSHRLCRLTAGLVPAGLYNSLWRFDIAVNPVFHCNTAAMKKWFPRLQPRRMADCIAEI